MIFEDEKKTKRAIHSISYNFLLSTIKPDFSQPKSSYLGGFKDSPNLLFVMVAI